MIHNILGLAGVIIASFIFSVLFWNRRDYKIFSDWWTASGQAIFLISFLVIGGLAAGYFRQF